MAGTRRDKKTNSTGKGWKWAFFILLALVIGAVIWVIYLVQPVGLDEATEQTTEEAVIAEGSMSFELLTDKEQVNRVVNLYLQEELDERFSDFTVSIDDLVILDGIIEVLGFDAEFALMMEPYVMENGNLQLRAQSIQLGSFELPVGVALNILSQQLALPDWIQVDSEQQFILVAFNEFSLNNGAQLRIDRIDLENDDIRLDIILPEEAIR